MIFSIFSGADAFSFPWLPAISRSLSDMRFLGAMKNSERGRILPPHFGKISHDHGDLEHLFLK